MIANIALKAEFSQFIRLIPSEIGIVFNFLCYIAALKGLDERKVKNRAEQLNVRELAIETMYKQLTENQDINKQ